MITKKLIFASLAKLNYGANSVFAMKCEFLSHIRQGYSGFDRGQKGTRHETVAFTTDFSYDESS